jgi:hypothetical protein
MKLGHGLYALIGHQSKTTPIPPRMLLIIKSKDNDNQDRCLIQILCVANEEIRGK